MVPGVSLGRTVHVGPKGIVVPRATEAFRVIVVSAASAARKGSKAPVATVVCKALKGLKARVV